MCCPPGCPQRSTPLGDWCDGQDIVVAAHAAVAEVMGDGCDGIQFVDRGCWATYFTYTINRCAVCPEQR